MCVTDERPSALIDASEVHSNANPLPMNATESRLDVSSDDNSEPSKK